MRVFQCFFVLGHGRSSGARIAGGKENGFNQVKVFFFDHAPHQHRAHHAAPADQAGDISCFHKQNLFFLWRLSREPTRKIHGSRQCWRATAVVRPYLPAKIIGSKQSRRHFSERTVAIYVYLAILLTYGAVS